MRRELKRFNFEAMHFPPSRETVFSWAKEIAPMAREIIAWTDESDPYRRVVVEAVFPAVLPIGGCGNAQP